MRFGTTRRRLLEGVASLSLAATGRAVGRTEASRSDGFDPAVHGFGFRNWSTKAAAYPEHDHDEIGEDQVRRVVGRRWAEPAETVADVDVANLPAALVDAIAKQVYVTVNQQSATNGHCYGMVFAAQQYYENPDSLPAGRSAASDLTRPEGPVGKEIDLYQLTQFLNFHAWVGRRGMVRPRWLDYAAQLKRLTSVVDEFGTAGITLFDAATRRAHQVLVYDYRRESGRTRLFVYDPNHAAGRYADAAPRSVDVDTGGDRPTVRRYDDSYDGFVFNRRDRIVAAQSAPVPFALVERRGDRLRDAVFRLAVFVVDSPAVEMTVTGPDGRPLLRDRGTYMDRGASAYSLMRYRYGFSPGAYRVRVVGKRAAEYTLEALVADDEGSRLDAATSRSIAAGEVHRYVAEVPRDGTGSLDVESEDLPWFAGLAGAGVGAGAAVGGYSYLRNRSGSADESGSE